MGQKKKLLERLRRQPAPKDFRWEEAVTLLESNDFETSCNGGSHHTFTHVSGFRLAMSKTHPGGILKSYQVKALIQALEQVGAGG